MQVTGETGIKVPAHTPQQAITELSQAMSRLANDSALRLQLGQAGQQRVCAELNWDYIGQNFAETYRMVLEDAYKDK